jgi:hypothetical protein
MHQQIVVVPLLFPEERLPAGRIAGDRPSVEPNDRPDQASEQCALEKRSQAAMRERHYHFVS